MAEIKSEHWNDEGGNPAGGITQGAGFVISWQNGPLAVDGVRREQNGAFVEDLTQAIIDRIDYYQASRFACSENEDALHHLLLALHCMNQRTAARTAQGVEGTHEVHTPGKDITWKEGT